MEYREATKRYAQAAGGERQKPHKSRSYLRKDCWHLLDRDGRLLAVVRPDGTVTHGAVLLAWSRQFSAGMPAPIRQPVITGTRS